MIHNTDEKQYYLAGFVNLFNVVPTFVYPVFVRNGQYFLEDGETDTIHRLENLIFSPMLFIHFIHYQPRSILPIKLDLGRFMLS